MRVLVTGSSGLIGKHLVTHLRDRGHDVARLIRHPEAASDAFRWAPQSGVLEAASLATFDGIVHLAGEPIEGRWDQEKKRKIRDSRVDGTRLLVDRLTELDSPPNVLIAASAIGYYGNRGDEVLTEVSGPGDLFLSGVCEAWEAETHPAAGAGIRVVNARLGIVLSTEGGALEKMLGPFKMGLGGKVGSGRQWYSWISLDDAVGALEHCLLTDSIAGPVNIVAPEPVRNEAFCRLLGEALDRPAMAALPAFAARMAFGELADELLLASMRVEPARLRESGFEFRHRSAGEALQHLLETST